MRAALLTRLRAAVVRLMRARAHWRYRRGACICCGITDGSTFGTVREGVCYDCYWRWTFDHWRPWWLRLLAVVWLPFSFTAPGDPRATAPAVTLQWTAPGDDSTSGQAAAYDLRMSSAPITAATFPAAAAIQMARPQAAGALEQVNVPLAAGATRYFALRTSDEAGNVSGLSNMAQGTAQAVSAAAVAYRVIGRDQGGYVFYTLCYADSNGTAYPVPAAPGTRQTVWLAFMSPWANFDPEGVDYAISAQWADGTWSEPFACERIAGGLADSDYFLDRTDPKHAQLRDTIRWAWWPADAYSTTWRRLERQADVQRALAARICELGWNPVPLGDGSFVPCP